MKIDEKRSVPYALIKEPIETLVEATANLLERHWDHRYVHVDSGPFTFSVFVRMAFNTYGTIGFICADNDRDPSRKPEYALSLAPLTRTMFENLITMIYLLDDVPNNIPAYFKSAYVARVRELNHIRQYNNTPDWQPYIASLQAAITELETSLNLTPQEISDPENVIGYWPTPGKLKNTLKTKYRGAASVPDYIPFIEFMNSWLYRELSGETHFDYKAFSEKGIFFSKLLAHQVGAMHPSEEAADKQKAQLLEVHKTSQIFFCVTLMMAILSEIEIHFNYGLNQKAIFIWEVLRGASDISKEIYEFRYKDKLA